MKAVRIGLLLLGITCVGLFAVVRHNYMRTPSGELVETITRIGFPSSPWYERVERGGAATWEIHPVSAGAAFGLTALGCFVGIVRLRPRKSTHAAPDAEPGAAADGGA